MQRFEASSRAGAPQPAEVTDFFAGLEQRLLSQFRLDQDAIVGALGAVGAAGGSGTAAPIVLLPDDDAAPDVTCATCGRVFDALRIAIHSRACARLKNKVPPAIVAAQQRAESIRRQAWAQLAELSGPNGSTTRVAAQPAAGAAGRAPMARPHAPDAVRAASPPVGGRAASKPMAEGPRSKSILP